MPPSALLYDKNQEASLQNNVSINAHPNNVIPIATPTFRVTCNRVGKDHQFTSMDCAAKFGGAINDLLHWRVDLSNPDINVILNIVENSINISIALTGASLHRRNITQFGPTALRSTIAYNMLRLADIQNGDIVCDPMAGGGSISVEGAVNWISSFHICGDNHHAAGLRSVANRDYAGNQNNIRSMAMDVATWDVCCLPLRRNSVDIVVSDMPFGKRIGSKHKNWKLYDHALSEMARICRCSSGRAVLLTQDSKVMTKVLQQYKHLWKRRHCYWINIGGLTAAVYLLLRTEHEY
ncbi:uncharacterized protein TRIADDRAFT_25997 [Trichoplax adhaerens]|uniref:THUMP domain-containing protein n=1 Tax=Trichoplax adhaerens TaxID=10228 RepID=B3RXB5_TRIAD|nr:hypothetical protein TRIADDRAFT_25997 [Trichoplax adhaerens]EDV24840.1 hypothetical protein TRIADDRAFT_25997 [Trichoplax adhaerens]|eukprot:XP_002112730.1 hypothetical protein TRIADDRAFT_25997 [Trichoplax adhaerens]